MSLFNLLGEVKPFNELKGEYEYLNSIIKFLNNITFPVTVVLAVGAAVFGVVLAFLIIKAESAEKAQELKKRMWGLIISFIVLVACVWLLGFVLSNFDTIMSTIRSIGSGFVKN